MTQNSKTIKAVVFDLDGLMFNTEDIFEVAARDLLGRRGHELTDEIRRMMMGRRAFEAFDMLREVLSLEETVEELLEESDELYQTVLDAQLAPMPGLYELLEHIEANNLPKAVATSSHRTYLHNILGRFEMVDRFQHLFTAEDVSLGKPHPEIYLKSAEALQIDPSEMIVLEDSQAGTEAAHAAGACIISVPNRHTRTHDFTAATLVVDRLNHPSVMDLIG
ncbi:Phosphorylated carbohydrates phosphatase [Polystyrenella longa]|uniref:Phosphorylated carbohydrates phosphatase n=1 Tax=Polystyrenella longa TaxID=2528007 RepID=A0A518CNP9_9PLAN|nr:HAD family phosphatase [Polystyrenella longa]QDU80861.1 Phosphorylated carbohydrates phosphatase [Polystyrenella longa]